MLTLGEQTFRLKRGKIGVISDTHGLLRPEAAIALEGSELIIHAGDIGKPEVIDALNEIAPVVAIRGNNDRQSWARNIPDILNLRINGTSIRVIHNVREIDDDMASPGIRAVISGHSHIPGIVKRDQILFVNPGSAGPRRFKWPVAIGKIVLDGQKLSARILELKPARELG